MASKEQPITTAEEKEQTKDDDDDVIKLPDDTMAILQQFLREQAEREKALQTVEDNGSAAGATDQNDPATAVPKFKVFQENWVSLADFSICQT